jgi:hypothetical protein
MMLTAKSSARAPRRRRHRQRVRRSRSRGKSSSEAKPPSHRRLQNALMKREHLRRPAHRLETVSLLTSCATVAHASTDRVALCE